MSTPNAFSISQPVYAELGIATFPVVMTSDGKKVPAVKHWERIGLSGSSQLAEKFTNAEMIGFCAGSRSRLTVVDIDVTGDQPVADALSRFGETPLIVRTASEKHHLYYRHSGEDRQIRPWGKKDPIDILGGGSVIAPPSVALNRKRYEIIQGKLEDISNLPIIRDADDLKAAGKIVAARVTKGRRNKELFRYCLRAVKDAPSFDELFAIATEQNAKYLPPLSDAEVLATVKSAWHYEVKGRNWVGGGGVVGLDIDAIERLAGPHPEAFALLAFLRLYHREKSTFVLANATAAKLGWGVNRFRAARRRLEEAREIRCIRPGGRGKHDPPTFAWGRK